MFNRDIQSELLRSAAEYPVVTLTGPRQSGKSTILKETFPEYETVSLEDMDMRKFAAEDPRGFLRRFPEQTIIDEIQRVPSLLSYIQTHTDRLDREGVYCISGSQNIMLLQQVDQSLAGRTSVLKLLPLSHSEMMEAGILPRSIDEEIFNGGYPRIYHKNLNVAKYYRNYFETYVERDVRTVKKITDLDKFIRFTGLCAGRIGQLLNVASIATECGISVNAAHEWLSVLEASYVIYLLRPYHRNYNKRLVKSPKLYFIDTGLACHLLGLASPENLRNHYMRGSLFENMVVVDFLKKALNRGETPQIYFWRDSNGEEIDLIESSDDVPHAYEIKSGATLSEGYFSGIRKWRKYSEEPPENCSVIYGGDEFFPTKDGNLIPWMKQQ